MHVQLQGPRSRLFGSGSTSLLRSTTLLLMPGSDAFQKADEYWRDKSVRGMISNTTVQRTTSTGRPGNELRLWIRTNWHNGDARYQLALGTKGKRVLQASTTYTPNKQTGELKVWTKKAAEQPVGTRQRMAAKGSRWWRRS